MTETTPSLSSTVHAGSIVRLLLAPSIYAIYFAVVYFFVEAACNGGPDSGPALGGAAINSIVLIATAVTTVVLLLWTVVAFAGWWRVRRAGRAGQADRPLVRDFYALVGFMLSLLFTLVTLATGLPALILDACAWA
jgi:hypothetical protein